MFEQIVAEICKSNMGSLIKEDILNSNLIQKNGSSKYYRIIHFILNLKINPRMKESLLVRYLRKTSK